MCFDLVVQQTEPSSKAFKPNPQASLFVGVPGKVNFHSKSELNPDIRAGRGRIQMSIMIIVLEYAGNAAAVQHHGQRIVWEASALSMVLKCTRQPLSSAPIDMCTLAHHLCFPRAGHTHFFIHACVQGLPSFPAGPPRSKKKKKQAIIAIVCSTIHGIVKQAWEVNRIRCQGVTVLHMWEKYESLSSHQLHLYFKTEAHTV